MSGKCFCLLAILIVSVAAAAQERPEQLAQQSAESWLKLVDLGHYAESWDHASQPFRSAVSKEQWTEKIRAVREPFGKVLSRKLKSANYTTTLPGAPDGQYVVIQYDTSFEHKQSAVETITPMLDQDGSWRVSGYFIR